MSDFYEMNTCASSLAILFSKLLRVPEDAQQILIAGIFLDCSEPVFITTTAGHGQFAAELSYLLLKCDYALF